MLTSDLVRVRKKAGRLAPRFLTHDDRERLASVADALASTYRSMIGASKAELDAAASAIPFGARDRVVVAGLRKLCDDRTELEQKSDIEPMVARTTLFGIAAAAHREGSFDRDAALAAAAAKLGCDEQSILASLFADLREAQTIRSFEPTSGAELLDRYDLALVQALVLRAKRLVVSFSDRRPSAVRDLFRAARFHGLLHVIERGSDGGFVVTLDGPFSLFESVQKYGLRLALFLPTALALEKFTLRAELSWGPARTEAELVLTQDDRPSLPREKLHFTRPEVEALKAAFAALGSAWDVEDNDRIVVTKAGVAVVPDLVFENRETGEEVFLEVFGFWSRAAIWSRIEQIREGLPARLLLAVGKQARVSREALGEEEGGSAIVVFRSSISAKEVLRLLDLPGRSMS